MKRQRKRQNDGRRQSSSPISFFARYSFSERIRGRRRGGDKYRFRLVSLRGRSEGERAAACAHVVQISWGVFVVVARSKYVANDIFVFVVIFTESECKCRWRFNFASIFFKKIKKVNMLLTYVE